MLRPTGTRPGLRRLLGYAFTSRAQTASRMDKLKITSKTMSQQSHTRVVRSPDRSGQNAERYGQCPERQGWTRRTGIPRRPHTGQHPTVRTPTGAVIEDFSGRSAADNDFLSQSPPPRDRVGAPVAPSCDRRWNGAQSRWALSLLHFRLRMPCEAVGQGANNAKSCKHTD